MRLHVSFCGSAPLTTVDGRNPAPVEVGTLSHYLQGFIHPRWLFGISSINSIHLSGTKALLAAALH